jgi:maleate isomerase
MIPSVNTVMEPDFYSVLPPSITLHTQRLWAPPRSEKKANDRSDAVVETEERYGRMNEDVDQAVKYLMTASVDVVAYGCTTGSFLWGYEAERQLEQQIRKSSGRPTVSTTGAIIDALRAVGARRLTILTPYTAEVNRRLCDYMTAEREFEVGGIHTDPKALGSSLAVATEEPEEIFEFAATHCSAGSDTVLCVCTAWRAFEAAPALESRLGVPVVTSNQATIWSALAELRYRPDPARYGSLFARPVAVPAAH